MTNRQSYWLGFATGWMLCLGLWLVSDCEAEEYWPEAPAKAYHKAALVVFDQFPKSDGEGTYRGEASGVLLEGYKVLTANHAVDGDTFDVMFLDGTVSKAVVLKRSEEYDWLIGVVGRVPENAITARLSTAPVKPGDMLDFVGFGGPYTKMGGEDRKLMRRWKARAAWATTPAVIFSDTFAVPGDSGGPVFNEAGDVVGTISGGWFFTIRQKKMVCWPLRAYRPTYREPKE